MLDYAHDLRVPVGLYHGPHISYLSPSFTMLAYGGGLRNRGHPAIKKSLGVLREPVFSKGEIP